MNSQCSACGKEQASVFCNCRNQETFLCEDNVMKHMIRYPSTPHTFMPIQAYGGYKAPGYTERLAAREEALNQGRLKLVNNLTKVDQSIAELNSGIEQIINALRRYEKETVQHLIEVRAKIKGWIDEGIAQAQNTIFEDNPTISSKFVDMLRTSSPDADYELFTYSINTASIINQIQDYFTDNFSRKE